MKRLTDVKVAGQRMANLCFNLSQTPGHVLTQKDVEGMRELYKAWDEAIAKEAKRRETRRTR